MEATITLSKISSIQYYSATIFPRFGYFRMEQSRLSRSSKFQLNRKTRWADLALILVNRHEDSREFRLFYKAQLQGFWKFAHHYWWIQGSRFLAKYTALFGNWITCADRIVHSLTIFNWNKLFRCLDFFFVTFLFSVGRAPHIARRTIQFSKRHYGKNHFQRTPANNGRNNSWDSDFRLTLPDYIISAIADKNALGLVSHLTEFQFLFYFCNVSPNEFVMIMISLSEKKWRSIGKLPSSYENLDPLKGLD